MKSEYYTRTLKRDEIVKLRRLGNCENFVGKREELVFDAFFDSEPVERAYRMGVIR